MKVLHINTGDNNGGSGKAARRLSAQLNKSGVDSKLLVLDKTVIDEDVIGFFDFLNTTKFQKIKSIAQRNLLPSFNQWRIRNENQGLEMFTFPNSMIDVTIHPDYQACDIVHLHLIYDFVDIPTFFSKNTKPIIWTMHDMSAFTGGWHIHDESKDISDKLNQIGLRNLKIKTKSYNKQRKLFITTPSNWLMDKVNESNLFVGRDKFVIPNGIDMNIFKPRNKEFARDVLNLPQDSKIILFVCDNIDRKNKGFEIFAECYRQLGNKYKFVVVGRRNALLGNEYPDVIKLGYINSDQQMSLVYTASDVTILPSKYESFSLVTIESMACGTPVIAFNTSGPAEIILHKKDGYLAEFGNIKDFVDGIQFVCNNEQLNSEFNFHAATKSNNYSIELQANKFIELYDIII